MTLPTHVEGEGPEAEAVNRFIDILWDHATTPVPLEDLITLAVANYDLCD